MNREVKKLLAVIVDRCDNALCHLPANHPKHRRYFDLFKELARIVTEIAGESDVLWWKEYTENRVNYWKIFDYNRPKIREALAKLPPEISIQIVEKLKQLPGNDILLMDYGREELMKKVTSAGGEEIKEEEIFWEFKLRRDWGIWRVELYPRPEWISFEEYARGAYEIVLDMEGNRAAISLSEIRDSIKQEIESFEDIFIRRNEIELRFKDNPNIHEDIRNALLKINTIILEIKDRMGKIEKELCEIAALKRD